MIGAGKHDSFGRPIPLNTDARPIVMGVTWRKLVFKCTLQMDRTTLRERLLPHQLAVGVSCGAEAMLHATREWLKANSHKPDVVLLQIDVSNAFNTVLPEQFLQDAVEHSPASVLLRRADSIGLSRRISVVRAGSAGSSHFLFESLSYAP